MSKIIQNKGSKHSLFIRSMILNGKIKQKQYELRIEYDVYKSYYFYIEYRMFDIFIYKKLKIYIKIYMKKISYIMVLFLSESEIEMMFIENNDVCLHRFLLNDVLNEIKDQRQVRIRNGEPCVNCYAYGCPCADCHNNESYMNYPYGCSCADCHNNNKRNTTMMTYAQFCDSSTCDSLTRYRTSFKRLNPIIDQEEEYMFDG